MKTCISFATNMVCLGYSTQSQDLEPVVEEKFEEWKLAKILDRVLARLAQKAGNPVAEVTLFTLELCAADSAVYLK